MILAVNCIIIYILLSIIDNKILGIYHNMLAINNEIKKYRSENILNYYSVPQQPTPAPRI